MVLVSKVNATGMVSARRLFEVLIWRNCVVPCPIFVVNCFGLIVYFLAYVEWQERNV